MTQQAAISGLALVRNPRWVEASCWRRQSEKNDDKARQALFTQYLPFAKKLAANEFYGRRKDNYELVDLEQLAIEALLVSIDRYDPLRRIPFTAFARRRIKGNIADGVASMSELGRQFRHQHQAEKDRINSLKRQQSDRKQKPIDALRELTIGLALGMMLEGTRLYLDEEKLPLNPDGYDSLVWKNMTMKIDSELESLPDPQSFIIRQHYQNDVSFTQIAELLGLTKGRISQLHRKALDLLRKRIGKI